MAQTADEIMNEGLWGIWPFVATKDSGLAISAVGAAILSYGYY
jgi:hypothetical protein